MDKKFNGVKQNENAETQEGFAKKNFAKIAGIGAIVVAAGTLLTACGSNEKSAKNSADNAPKTEQSAKNSESSESESSSENQNGDTNKNDISFGDFKSQLTAAGYTINSAEVTTDSNGHQLYTAQITCPNGNTGYLNYDDHTWIINGSTSSVFYKADVAQSVFFN